MNPKQVIENLQAVNRRQQATMEDLSRRYVCLEAETKKKIMKLLREVVDETRGWPAADALNHIEQFVREEL
jgi:hypothetical protein